VTDLNLVCEDKKDKINVNEIYVHKRQGNANTLKIDCFKMKMFYTKMLFFTKNFQNFHVALFLFFIFLITIFTSRHILFLETLTRL